MTVLQQQCLLSYLGYNPGPLDGVMGERTQGALSRFRQDAGLEPEGTAGEETWRALRQWVGEDRKKPEGTQSAQGWWQQIRHFTREEFRCKCGGRYCNGYPAEMQEAVVKIADAARAHFGKPAHVISGLRCQQWNAHEGGVANSQHMYGEAIDLRIDGVDSEKLRQFVESQPGHRYSYRINSTNVHFDINKVGR